MYYTFLYHDYRIYSANGTELTSNSRSISGLIMLRKRSILRFRRVCFAYSRFFIEAAHMACINRESLNIGDLQNNLETVVDERIQMHTFSVNKILDATS